MDPVVHFEIPTEDNQRASTFYNTVFGWNMSDMGSDMGEYIMVTTIESDKNVPKKPGGINGGLYPKPKDKPEQSPSFVIAVKDIQAHMKKVTDAGGKVLGEPTEIPNVGWYVSFEDTEGNRASLLEPTMPMAS